MSDKNRPPLEVVRTSRHQWTLPEIFAMGIAVIGEEVARVYNDRAMWADVPLSDRKFERIASCMRLLLAMYKEKREATAARALEAISEKQIEEMIAAKLLERGIPEADVQEMISRLEKA